MKVKISRSLLAEIEADVARDPAHERCGLLLGDDALIQKMVLTANVHPQPARHFELDPAALIAAVRSAREGGLGIIGHYHSHPSGNCEPSRMDADRQPPMDAIGSFCRLEETCGYGKAGKAARFTGALTR